MDSALQSVLKWVILFIFFVNSWFIREEWQHDSWIQTCRMRLSQFLCRTVYGAWCWIVVLWHFVVDGSSWRVMLLAAGRRWLQGVFVQMSAFKLEWGCSGSRSTGYGEVEHGKQEERRKRIWDREAEEKYDIRKRKGKKVIGSKDFKKRKTGN